MAIKQKIKKIGGTLALLGALIGGSSCNSDYYPKQPMYIINSIPPIKGELIKLLKGECDIVHIDQMPKEEGKLLLENILAYGKHISL